MYTPTHTQATQLQLTLEQNGFELHGSTSTRILFSVVGIIVQHDPWLVESEDGRTLRCGGAVDTDKEAGI